jgi:prevent-host-death family protein
MPKKTAFDTSPVTTTQLRSSLGNILRRVTGKKQERIVVVQRGEPKAVLISLEDYLDLVAPETPLMAGIRAHSVAHGGDKITMEEIDAEIATVRAERKEKDARSVRCA